MSATRPIRITQVSASDTGGGAERVAADLHRGCLGRGLQSLLAVGFRFDDVPESLEIPNDAERSSWARAFLRLQPDLPGAHGQLSIRQVFVRRALKSLAEPSRARRRALGYEDFDYPGTKRLLDLGGEQRDVLHLHNLHGGYFDLRCLPWLTQQVPTVVTLHDTWLTSGHCAYMLECERWRTGCGHCPHLDTHPAVPRDKTAENWAFKRDILQRSRVHVVGPSRWILDKAADSILADATINARLIPNGVDQTVFAPADKTAARLALGLPVESLILVFSGAARNSPYKDSATLSAALPEIVRRVAPREVLLLSLGARVNASPVPGARVVSVPFLDDPGDVARYLQAADLALHTAHAENHPLAILEAQSCGLPVVASNVGGVPETLVDGETGLLVPPDDPGALAQEASGLLFDDPRRESMGRAALAHASGRFGLDRMVDEYVRLYQELVGGS